MAELNSIQGKRLPLRRIFDVIRLKRKEITSIYFFSIMAGLLQLSIPLGIQAIITFIQAYTFSTSLWVLIILVILGVGISGGFQVIQLKIIERISQQIFARYGLQYAYHIPRLDMKSTDEYYLPELVNRFFDTVNLQKGLSKLLIDIPGASIQIIFGLLLLSFYSSIFIIFGILLLIVLVVLLYATSARGLATSIEESTYKYKVASWLEDLGRSLKTFKFGKGTLWHLKKSDQLMTGYLEARTSHFRILLVQYWALIFFKIFITASMLLVGAALAINNQINIGQFVAAEIVIIMIMNSVEKFIFSLDNVYDLLTSVEKLEKILDKPLEKDGAVNLPPCSNGLDVKGINVDFGFKPDKIILHNLSFTIPSGSKVCLMGDEGAGKSMFLRLLTGTFTEFKGAITINEIPINNYITDSLRKQTGIVIHDQDIFDGTILENITMGSDDASLSYLAELASVTNFSYYLADLPDGYDTHLKTSGKQLNRSKIQKILLMRALIHKPRLLLLEDPWSTIVSDVKEDIQNYILDKLKDVTVVVSTNDEAFARKCDKVIVLSKGRIVKQGRPEEVLLSIS